MSVMASSRRRVTGGLRALSPRPTTARRFGPWPVPIAFFVFVPLVLRNDYYIDVASVAMTFVVLGAAFNLLYGYVGLLSFAQVAFFGIGGYATAWLVTATGLWQPLAFLAGGLVAALAATVVGLVTVRLSEGAFAIITLSFTLLCAVVAAEWTSVTGGRQGIFGLPAPQFAIGAVELEAVSPSQYLWLLSGFTLAALWGMRRIVVSPVGKVLVAIRDNEALAKAQGYSTNRYKLAVFVASAFVTGIAGALHVFRLTAIDPSVFDFYLMQVMLIVVILGGAGTYWPVVVSAVAFAALPEFLRLADEARLVLYGVLLVVGLVFTPQGLGGTLKERAIRRRLRDLEEDS
ncbi:branched-chain amino acid ABC transporter permease [Kribbella shirazensis]|uniref:Branched-chain amino acid transport system permease protein n=1 Tax=Kribbella shirazensis TaxID=1105143 RepID=A0A7X5VC46_9ACTN|nr:branched-chain amino acid ABC transporter permease [Kribbella shirazensis]NIK58509.1 branched-chain amino acid transport system permease protein [Kribbella shirazensis]